MLETIVQGLSEELEANAQAWEELLSTELDFTELERRLREVTQRFSAAVLHDMLCKILTGRDFLAQLKQLGGRLGMRFKEYRVVQVRLASGRYIEVLTPWFVKAAPQRGRRKRGPNGRGSHLGLELLGFIGRASAGLVSEVVQAALLCPSLAVARSVLGRRGIDVDVKTIRRLCRTLGEGGLARRGEVALTGTEELSGHTLVIGIDGGRLRERRKKRGRWKKGAKRAGYHTDWKEPKLFTIYLLDAHGEPVKEFAPLHDATMQDHHGLFTLLEQYLKALELSALNRVVFCADGASWIWSGVQRLCQQLKLDPKRVEQVIDYTHAKQNLQEIVDLLPARLKAREHLEKRWKTLLWQGDVQALHDAIARVFSGKKKQAALAKWDRYFHKNQARMQYEHFKHNAIPCGSGGVESAIRRVINLRLKAPGTFWTRAMAECFLFLRSQLLAGRWDIFLRNLTRQLAQMLESQCVTQPPPQVVELPHAA